MSCTALLHDAGTTCTKTMDDNRTRSAVISYVNALVVVSSPAYGRKSVGNVCVRLILTRIRFRASDFGQVARINIIRAKSKQAFCAEMMLGSFVFFCSCDSAVRFLDSEKSSQRRLLLCLAPRRVHFAPPWTKASKQRELIRGSVGA